jgi:hypothetical protein
MSNIYNSGNISLYKKFTDLLVPGLVLHNLLNNTSAQVRKVEKDVCGYFMVTVMYSNFTHIILDYKRLMLNNHWKILRTEPMWKYEREDFGPNSFF